jgi:peptidyl-prolyl cis-trans isomerase D
MMQAFRSSAKVIAVVFATLMLIFMLTSIDWSTISSNRSVGKVNGEAIDARTYESVVQQAVDQRQQQSPGRLGLEDYAQIRDQVWDQFIENNVLTGEYERRGITVSEDEVIAALRTTPPPEFQKLPEFQTDSQFDLAKYQRWLVSAGAQPYVDALASQYREQLRRNKLYRSVAGDVYLSDAAIWEQYRDENEKVKVGLTAIVPRNAVPDSAVSVTPAEVAAFYKAHPDQFKRPRSAFLSYVALPRVTSASDTAAALAHAQSVREEIVGGAPFGEVARRESSDTVSGNKGGDLGEWTKGTFDPAFDSAAFSLPLNTVSQPVLSQFGYHIIQVTSRTGNKAKGRHVLIPIEVAGEHRDLLDAQADTLDRLAAERTDAAALDTVARALKLPVGRVGPVPEGTKVQAGNLVVPDAGVWAFETDPGTLSSVIETPYAFYVFRLDSLHDAGTPALADIRQAVESAVRDEKKWTRAREIAKEYLAKVEAGTPMAKAAEEMKLAHREFGPFSRVDPPLTNPVVVGAAFGLDAGQRSGVLDTKEGLYVLEGLDHVKADSAEFTKKLDELRAQAIRGARQARVQAYLASMRESAKIVDRRAEVLREGQRQAAQQAPTPAGF